MTILGWKHFLVVLMAGIALMLFSGPAASAQDGPGQGLRINTFFDHLSAADVDRGPGRLSVTGAGFSLAWSHFTFGYRRAMFTLGGQTGPALWQWDPKSLGGPADPAPRRQLPRPVQ